MSEPDAITGMWVDPAVLEDLARCWEHEAELASAAATHELPGSCRALRQEHLRTLARTKRAYAAEMRRLVIPVSGPFEDYEHWRAVLDTERPAGRTGS